MKPHIPQQPLVPIALLIDDLRHNLAQIPNGCAYAKPLSRTVMAQLVNALEWQQCEIANLQSVARLADELARTPSEESHA